MSENLPPFTIDGTRYDMTTYAGRLQHFFEMVDPRMAFVPLADSDKAKQMLEDYRRGIIPTNLTNEELWRSRRIVEAVYHPQSKEPVFWPFRMSTFVITNVPIICGMLLSPPTIFNTVFWQWLNQSYNAGFNYCNRSDAGNKDSGSNEAIVKAYFGACVSSVGLSVGFNQALKRAKGLSPGTLNVLQKCVPYIAVASAGMVNSTLMRWNETQTGIPVFNKDGQQVGVSKKAGQLGLFYTALTRATLSAPILLLPPLVMAGLDKLGVAKPTHSTARRFPFELTVIAGSLWLALPFAVAVFPQMMKVDAKKLEPEFHNLGEQTLFYSKGV